MPNVRMPDGVVVAFPNDMPPEQIKSLIASKFPDVAAKAAPQSNAVRLQGKVADLPSKQNPNDSYLSQGLSGFNEGIANTLGAPVEIANSVIGAGMAGSNALFGTDFRPAQNPVGGQQFFRQMMAPTMAPESSDPMKQGVRRVAQEVGAFAIPGMGVVGKAAKPVATAAKELAAAVGSGTGAAIAQQVAPGNPIAEMAGQLIGGMAPGGIARMAKGSGVPKTAPSVDELQAMKSAAYKAADDAGVAYTPQAYDKALVEMVDSFKKDRFNPKRHKAAAAVFETLAQERGKPLTLTELDQLRQIVRRDVVNPSYASADMAADGHFGELMLDAIDEMIAKAGQGDVISGSAQNGAQLINTARELNTRLRKTELIETALVKAERRTASTGSGGNINNAIRQNIRAILDSPKKSRAFTAEERATMEKLVRQGKMEDLLRWVGKFAPGGNGLIGMIQVGGTLLNPAVAAMPVAGMVAKGMADRGTLNQAAALQAQIARGAPAPRPLPKPYSLPLLAAQGANAMGN